MLQTQCVRLVVPPVTLTRRDSIGYRWQLSEPAASSADSWRGVGRDTADRPRGLWEGTYESNLGCGPDIGRAGACRRVRGECASRASHRAIGQRVPRRRLPGPCRARHGALPRPRGHRPDGRPHRSRCDAQPDALWLRSVVAEIGLQHPRGHDRPRLRPHDRDRRRLRLQQRRGRSGHLSRPVRAGRLHHRQRLLQEGQPGRPAG